MWLYNTGPCHIYIGSASLNIDANGPSLTGSVDPAELSVQPYYAGTCEVYPQVEEIQYFNPVFNDIGGPMVQVDDEYQGMKKIITLDMNRFVETVINFLDFDDADGSEGTRGRGKLVLANGQWARLWITFDNFGTINQVAPDLPPGEMYYCVKQIAKYYDRLGTQHRKTRLVLEATPVYVAAFRGFRLYSRNSGFFQGLPAPG